MKNNDIQITIGVVLALSGLGLLITSFDFREFIAIGMFVLGWVMWLDGKQQ